MTPPFPPPLALPPLPPEATQCLRERFGFSAFRAGQEDIVAAMLAGRDVLAIMPTGGGKSLCYQLPACISEGVTLVVSPLIALMKDQVDALAARGIPAAAVNSSLSFEQVRQIMDQVKSGHTRLLYVAPERFGSRWFMAAMSGVKVARVAVDEAHCISQWGHDFRPAYMAIGEAVVRLGRPPVAALTATATPQVQDDIGEKLGLVSPFRTVTGFDRRNLFLEVREGGKKKDALGEFLNTQPGPGIIYCATRKHVEEVAAALSAGGAKHGGVTAYHAGMPDPQRTQAQEAFIGGNTGIIVATNAFGMGVDKADVRFVLHYDMPGTLEAYYQEAGRAGRDGKPARCTVLFGGGDRFTQEFFINGTYPTAEFVRQVWQALSRNAEDGVTELSNRDLLAMVSEEGSEFAVSAALKLLEQAGGIQRLNPRSNPALIRVLNRSRISGRATVQLQILAALDFHLPADDRNGAVEISPLDLAHDANLDPDALMRGLHAMHEAGAIAYTPPFRGRGVRLMSTGVPPVDFDAVENKRAWALGCLDSMEAYCRSGGCRRAAILAHFGETLSEPCGACDRCRDGGATLPVEATELARKVLSGVARCRRGSVSFGAQTVAAHLTGGNTDTVRRYGLDKASTYGLLRDLGQKQVVDLLEQLTAQGLLKRQDAGGEGSGGRRPVLVMTEAGLSVLKGERGDVRLRLPTAESPAPAARRAGVGGGPGREMVRETSGETFRETVREAGRAEADLYVAHADPELLALLKGVRNRTAREEGIAAYLVFADRTLAEMAVLRPADRAAMLAVNGVGERKFERFGAIFLRAIRDHA